MNVDIYVRYLILLILLKPSYSSLIITPAILASTKYVHEHSVNDASLQKLHTWKEDISHHAFLFLNWGGHLVLLFTDISALMFCM